MLDVGCSRKFQRAEAVLGAPRMTRFHVAALLAVASGGLSLIFGKPTLFAIAVIVFAIVAGLGVAFPQLSFFGPYICKGNATQKRVALTFDDGPDARSTPALLDLLREAGVSATFFCVGDRVSAHRELATRIVSEGHLLENHSFAHSNATNFFGLGRLRDELQRTQDAVKEATGRTPTLFRPPMGLSNPNTFRAARAVGLKVIGWSVRSLDTMTPDSERVAQRVMGRLSPGGIILLHDGNIPAKRLVMTVRLLLSNLKQSGYEVVRLDKLLE
jgi:peptidoglycan/xylan/chitin deacetylase (PgdA/CDA1 family)